MQQDSALTRRLKLAAPLIQGPFGSGLSSVDLAVVVSESGGLGSFGVHHLDGAGIRDVAARIRARTDRAFALNLWVPHQGADDPPLTDMQWNEAVDLLRPWFDELRVPVPDRPKRFMPRYDEQLETVLELAPPVFSFVFGVPSPEALEGCRARGICSIGAATTADEAKLLADSGVDAVVATGFEAGGHRVSFLREPEDCLTGTLALVPQVLDTVKVPVIAAGGIADARGVSAVLQLGAHAAQVGTAFLACEESNASPLHRQMLFSDAARRTTLTRAFTGRLARSIHNEFIEKLQDAAARLPPYPVQAWLTGRLKEAAVKQGRWDAMSLWSGQGAPLLKHRRAGALFESLAGRPQPR
jgi:nitronate monooxygenase